MFDLRSLFDKVVDLSPMDRSNFLRDLQEREPAQYASLQGLLSAHDEPSAFFEQDGGIWAQMAPADLTGRRFGAYSIVRVIGRGGMGTVYEATRADEAFHKTVAIKLISVMLLSDSFRRERQILAQLEHPNIARLLDAGATDDGLPYLVMEYVDGVPLDQYVEAHRLSLEEVLKLFLQVTAAVSFAHQKLIVHRDLKPNNILVTQRREVKLLDFGIAKSLNPNRNETATVSVRLTPEFASPEQIQGGTISTSSDVYSLGVLLFHTLTGGVRPYRTTGENVSELLQAVLESETPRPSSVASPKYAKKLKGDVDNIILKAMAKEPERRYASVEQLEQDIERYLTGRPVLARGDAWGYLAGKFIRRHRLAVGAALVIALTIATGMNTTMRQRAAADARYQSVRSLATSILFDVNESLKEVPGAGQARKQAVMAALKHLEALAERSGDDPALTEDLATAYEQAAEIMSGLPDGVNMATPSLVRAVALRRKLPESLKLADIERQLGNNQVNRGELEAAVESYRRSIGTAERQPQAPARVRSIGLAHSNLCTARMLMGRNEEAAGDCWAAVRMLQHMEGAVARLHSGEVLMKLGRMGEAREQLQAAVDGVDVLEPTSLAAIEELMGLFGKMPNSGRMQAVALWKRGVVLSRSGARDESLESFEQALRQVGGPRVAMKQVVAFAEACALYARAMELRREGQGQQAAEDSRKALNRLADSTSGAASLLRAELNSTLAKQSQ